MTLLRIFWGIMTLLILTGLGVLSMWGIPAPSVPIEKELSLTTISDS